MAEWSNPPLDPVFTILLDRIVALLTPLGTRYQHNSRRGDYWVSEDDTWPKMVEVEFLNLDLLRLPVIKLLQVLLAEYPDWSIAVRVEGIDETGKGRGMGLIVQSDRIGDELQREYLPAIFQDMRF
ncbi:hypothetical protein E0H22_10540 [Rhodopseudomonas boonkerdii]|uniref:hypothetical protein n=1 Tax=Rhodopseudomonas boonkerdii TaxID=475937 RepID=UPI001E371DB6|nr:hypothetical protein [Rhodopseudomonas boonkerdii]UGV26088.1 hypothetical protein E0H22_10540 [Rhodopseudomonas boonkerdii]